MAPTLFTPLNIGPISLSNRVVMAPLTRYRASDTHVHGDLAVEYYAQRTSVPGTLLITEATFISPRVSSLPESTLSNATCYCSCRSNLANSTNLPNPPNFRSCGRCLPLLLRGNANPPFILGIRLPQCPWNLQSSPDRRMEESHRCCPQEGQLHFPATVGARESCEASNSEGRGWW